MSEVTIAIKTLERPWALNMFLRDLRQHGFFGWECHVADDSERDLKDQYELEGVQKFHRLPHDVGLSAGRNFLVDHVETPYIFMSDDDSVLLRGKACLPRMLEVLKEGDFDIVAAPRIRADRHRPYHGILDRVGPDIIIRTGNRGHVAGHPLLELVPNFMICKTEALRTHRWDPAFKIAEHLEFYWRHRGKLKISMTFEVGFANRNTMNKRYAHYRRRGRRFVSMFRDREGIRNATVRTKHIPRLVRSFT